MATDPGPGVLGTRVAHEWRRTDPGRVPGSPDPRSHSRSPGRRAAAAAFRSGTTPAPAPVSAGSAHRRLRRFLLQFVKIPRSRGRLCWPGKYRIGSRTTRARNFFVFPGLGRKEQRHQRPKHVSVDLIIRQCEISNRREGVFFSRRGNGN